MRRLSISTAWEESRAILDRDGRLFVSVALALVALPTAVNSILNPAGVNASSPLWADCAALLASLIVLAGQLALIRLAIGPSITVGGAIGFGVRRLWVYFLAVLLVALCLVAIVMAVAFVMSAAGIPLNTAPATASPTALIVTLLFLGLLIYAGVRMVMAAPVATVEPVGPIAAITRSVALTRGHVLPLLGFLLIFLVGTIVLLVAVGSAATVVVRLLFGTIQAMSAGALVLALVQALVSAAVTTLFAVMLARLYLQLVERGEAQASVPSSGI